MSTREKIIVVFALLAMVYGAYIVFFEPKSQQPTFKRSQKGLESLEAFITKVKVAAAEGLSEKDNYIIQRAETQWEKDPLVQIKKAVKAETAPEDSAKRTEPETEISYTGYLEMGNVRLAIINGKEYETGDRLEQGGYIVRSISPTRVMLVTTDGSKISFIVPIQEVQ